MHDLSGEFEKQVCQIASLGVWQIVTGRPMKKRLEPVDDHRWNEKGGVFVTLRKAGEVRGSMGMLESATSLPETLFDAGATAATHDARKEPIDENEISYLEIEVTLLSKISKMDSIDDLVVGETGIIVSRGDNRAVLLPSVAEENGWNQEQFLEACCEKAQLSHKAWKDPNTLVEYFHSQTIQGGSLSRKIEGYI